MKVSRKLSTSLSSEITTGKANLDRAPSLAAIPDPGESLSSIAKAVRAIKNAIDTLTGASGSVLNKALTTQDLLDDGLLTYTPSLGLSAGDTTITISSDGGGGGGGGTPYDPTELGPSYPTPPSITGLQVTGTFRAVIIEWDAVAYRNFAFVEIWKNTVDNVASATLLAQTTGSIFTDVDVTAGVDYYYWIRAVNTDSTTGAFNAVGGTTGSPGKINGVDLNDLIITAGKIADGEISAAKLASDAVQLTKFASGIEPVSIVTGALPLVKSTGFIYRTDDGKMYRWNGTAYVSTVSGSDVTTGIDANNITVNQLVAGQIAAGAIGVDQLAAGAVRTDKLLVTGDGACITPDPATRDASAWTGVVAAGVTFVADSTSQTGYALRATGNATVVTQPPAIIDASKNYRLRIRAKQESGSSVTYLTVVFRDASNNVLTPATGWPSTGTYLYYGLVNQQMPVSWTAYDIAFGPNETAKIPVGTVSVQVGFLANYSGSGVQRITDVRLVEKAGSDLIVDGAITADKLLAGSVVAGKLGANAIIAGDGVIGTAAIDDAKIADLSATKINAGELKVGSYISSGGFSAGSTGWIIRANGTAEFASSHIRGQLTAAQINANGLTIRSPDGLTTILDASGTGALDWSVLTGAYPRHFIVTARGYLASSRLGTMGLWNGASHVSSGGGYWWNFLKVNRSTLAVTGSEYQHNSGTRTTEINAFLDSFTSSEFLVAFTNDAPDLNMVDSTVLAKLYTFGASKSKIGSAKFPTVLRNAWVFVGWPGLSDGAGLEIVANESNKCLELGFTVQSGSITGGHVGAAFQIDSSNASTYIASAAIGNAYIGDYIASTNFDGTISGSTITGNGTAGWAIAKGGKMVVDALVVRQQKFLANVTRQRLYSGSATTTVSGTVNYAVATVNGFVCSTGCTGVLELYLASSTARNIYVSTYLKAVNGGTTVYGPTSEIDYAFNGGRYYSTTGNYKCAVPFNLSWLYGGDYWTNPKNRLPGTSGIPLTPSLTSNTLTAGTWTLSVDVYILVYQPGTVLAGTELVYVDATVSGQLMEHQGVLPYVAGESPMV